MPGLPGEDRPRNARAVIERLTAYLAGVQERLRTAELARFEARSSRPRKKAKRRTLADAAQLARGGEPHAVEEGRRRRLQVGLAAAVLALSTVGGLAYDLPAPAPGSKPRLSWRLNETTLLHEQAVQAAR